MAITTVVASNYACVCSGTQPSHSGSAVLIRAALFVNQGEVKCSQTVFGRAIMAAQIGAILCAIPFSYACAKTIPHYKEDKTQVKASDVSCGALCGGLRAPHKLRARGQGAG
jgi:hypothetical protein